MLNKSFSMMLPYIEHMQHAEAINAQKAWLQADLAAAAANRAAVPWIIASSHYPVYHSSLALNADKSAAHYLGEAGEAEIEGQPLPKRKPLPALTDAQRNGVVFNEEALPLYTTADGHAFVDCPTGAADCTTVGEWHAAIAADLEPILLKYGVDMWNSGHVHDYESTWPIKNGNVTQTNYNEPKGIVHVTDGNAFFNRPGPRLVESAEILAAVTHPAVFAEEARRHADVIRTLQEL